MKRTNSRRTESNNVSIAAILSIVGGFIMIIGGISIFFLFGWYQSMFGGEGIFIMNRMMHSGDDGNGDIGDGIGWWWPGMMIATSSGAMIGGLIALSSLSLGAGAVSIAGGYKIYKHPESIRNWGFVVLTASIVGLFGLGGFGIGAIIGIVAGIIAIASSSSSSSRK